MQFLLDRKDEFQQNTRACHTGRFAHLCRRAKQQRVSRAFLEIHRPIRKVILDDGGLPVT
jgi:hypothetical protein